MKITIMSRLKAIEYTYKKHNHKYIIISISENTTSKPYFNKDISLIDVLYLHFDDVTKNDLNINPNYKTMSREDALKIKDFVDKYTTIDEIIIHCHAGISRSSAVTCGICKYLNMDDLWIWTSNYHPNRWCLNVMNDTLNLGFTKEDIDYRWKLYDNTHQKDEFKIKFKV